MHRDKWLKTGLLANLPSIDDEEGMATLLERETAYITSTRVTVGPTTLGLMLPILRRVFGAVPFVLTDDPVGTIPLVTRLQAPDRDLFINGLDVEVEMCLASSEALIHELRALVGDGALRVGSVPLRVDVDDSGFRLSIDAAIG